MSRDQSKYTIVQREKELCNIKYYYTIFESLGLASSSHISKIVRIKNTVLDSIILELSNNHFLNELVKHVKQDNRPECFGDIISRFT